VTDAELVAKKLALVEDAVRHGLTDLERIVAAIRSRC